MICVLTRLFKSWLAMKAELREPHQIPPKQLDTLIAQFMISVRKESNDSLPLNHNLRQYEPETLTAMHSSIHRYLNENGYSSNIKADDAFRHSRDVLSAKKKELKQLGKGNRPKAALPFSSQEIAILFNKKILGRSKYTDLIITVNKKMIFCYF